MIKDIVSVIKNKSVRLSVLSQLSAEILSFKDEGY